MTEEEEFEAMLEAETNKPRPHHYEFAHRALPGLFFERPEHLLTHLQEPDALQDLWRFTYEHLAEHGVICQALPVTGLTQVPIKLGSWQGVLVELPTVKGPAEALAVLLLMRSTKRLLGVLPDRHETRYFTLELGHDFVADAPCTFLCGWSVGKDGPVHNNYGQGPELVGFVDAVAEQLDYGA